MMPESDESSASELAPGSRHYRAFIGPSESYDQISAVQFNLLTFLGLRQHHLLLDIGCGSLRGGRLFIPYLLPGRYFGIEPEQWLIEEGIGNEVGRDLIEIKQPVFRNDSDFTLSAFDRQFDFILAQSIFSHASQAQISRCLAEARKVMGPSSIFAATFAQGEENYTGNAWVYPECVTYGLEHFTHLVEEQGLACLAIDWPHPAQQTWVLIIDPANAGNIPDVTDTARLLVLESDLKFLKQRLSRIEAHPYMRFGLRVNRLLGLIGRFANRARL